MKLDLQRTVVAVASGVAPGSRAIVRLSGSLTRQILSQLFLGAKDTALLESKVPLAASVECSLALSGRSELSRLPAIAYFWPDSRSFTGETCAELHVIGSMPIVEGLVSRLCALGASPAERGEFTLRSFLAGKVDLIQAEAILGVIEAEGPAQLHEALAQLGGNLSKPVRKMRDQLVELIAHLEAGLDFVEEDIEFISHEELLDQLTDIFKHVVALTKQLDTRDVRNRTAQVVIIGLPNSGKSSLFNCLVESERAIVSPLAGTTRDVITHPIELSGMCIELIDTAGFEEMQGDSPQAEAQIALQRRLRRADVALFCIDTSLPINESWRADQIQTLVQLGVSILTVGTKSELSPTLHNELSKDPPLVFDCKVSAHTGEGIAPLREQLTKLLASHRSELQSAALQHIAVRCRQSLASAANTLRRAIELAKSGEGEELVAMELRIALDDLSAVIGEVHSDDILGNIFSRFCIGK